MPILACFCALTTTDAGACTPTVAGTKTSLESGASATSRTVDLPAGVAAGDLIIAFIAKDKGSTANWPSPWVEIVEASNSIEASLFVAYLIASGGETSVTVTDASGPGDRSHHIAIRIPAASWHGTTPPEAVAAITGNSNAPNSGSLTPSWGAADTLWISTFAVVDFDTNSVTSYPTNYTDNNLSYGPTGSSAGIAIASRELNAATDDPGQFTLSGGNYWVAATVAVRPACGPLTIVKTAFQLDGTPIASGATIPNFLEFKYLLYINNQNIARSDVSVRDVLDPAFQYQAATIQVDNSVAECALTVCTAAEELTIFTAVDGAAFLSDAVDGDVTSYTGASSSVDAGNSTEANLQLDINADAVWAILFSAKMP